jgi:YebC/PmpR family DNA-binding regulatory protein
MAGQSHWAQIKHKKAKEDSKRGQAFTKLLKEITTAARIGGGDPNGNARLRLLLEKAKEINMPIDNSQRAIKRGTGELPGVSYEPITYEGYGPGSVAVIVEALTDNRNRTVGELRRIFSSNGGTLGETNSVSWMFERLGVIKTTGPKSIDEVLEKLIEYDINDVSFDENFYSIFTDPKSLETVKKAAIDAGYKIEEAELEMVPKTTLSVSPDQEKKALELLSELQDHEDAQNVYTNLA